MIREINCQTNAIQACLTLKVLLGLPLRQGEPARRHWFEPTGERFRCEPAATVRAWLVRAGLQHPVAPPE